MELLLIVVIIAKPNGLISLLMTELNSGRKKEVARGTTLLKVTKLKKSFGGVHALKGCLLRA